MCILTADLGSVLIRERVLLNHRAVAIICVVIICGVAAAVVLVLASTFQGIGSSRGCFNEQDMGESAARVNSLK
jgi:hypothetical protein